MTVLCNHNTPRQNLRGHVLEGISQVLLAEGQLASSPDFGILWSIQVSQHPQSHPHTTLQDKVWKPTGFKFFLISLSRVPALMAIISGAASGSWAMGEPHSEQNRRWTSWPDEPLLEYFLTGPLMVNWALGTTVTRAFLLATMLPLSRRGGTSRTVGRTTLSLAVIAVVVGRNSRLVDVRRVFDSFAKTVTGKRHCGKDRSDWIEWKCRQLRTFGGRRTIYTPASSLSLLLALSSTHNSLTTPSFFRLHTPSPLCPYGPVQLRFPPVGLFSPPIASCCRGSRHGMWAL